MSRTYIQNIFQTASHFKFGEPSKEPELFCIIKKIIQKPEHDQKIVLRNSWFCR